MGNKQIETLFHKKLLVLRVGGELGIKSHRTRKRMINNLLNNIDRLLGGRAKYSIMEYRSRILIVPEDERSLEEIASLIAKATSGVSSLSIALAGSSDEDVIIEEGRKFAVPLIKDNSSFALRVRREGSHKYTSIDIAKKLGSEILKANPTLKVDLKNPEYEIHLDIREKIVFYYTEKIAGIDGIPERSQGRSIVIIKPNSSSMLSALIMKKRGVHLVPIFFSTGKELQKDYINVIKRDINKKIIVVDISSFLETYSDYKSLCMLCQVYCEGVAQELAEERGLSTVISPTCFTCKDTRMSITALQYLESRSRVTVIRPIQMGYYGSKEVFKPIDELPCCLFRKFINYELTEDFDQNLLEKALSKHNKTMI